MPAGSTSDAIFAFWDVLPTLAELAGVPPASIDTDGTSAAAVLKGGPAPPPVTEPRTIPPWRGRRSPS